MAIIVNADLGDLNNVDLTTNPPSDQDVLVYNQSASKWIPKKITTSEQNINTNSNTYKIELAKWNINNNNTNPAETTKGINDAIVWAMSQGYNHVVLPKGIYQLKIDPTSFSCIIMRSGLHFEMEEGCTLQLETNSSPWYRVFEVRGISNSKITGGTIVGDKETHIYEIGVKFERGGVNQDGSLNNNPNFIRSKVINRYDNPGLLRAFRLWSIPGVSNTNYSFYQYKDNVSASTLVGVRTNGQFAPGAPTGRGWFEGIENANKMIFVIDISTSPLTDQQIAVINAKIDSQHYTHEWGQGIEILGSTKIEIRNVEIKNCTGDAMSTGWLEYKPNPADYTQEQMGSDILIEHCNFHHCRRQGISLGGANDVYVLNNKIHHIGKADDGVSTDFRNGTAPMFGIDIESMVGESNIPYKFPYYKREGFELNFRIYIYNNHIYNNERGHFVNADGNDVILENNRFEGYNIGNVSSSQMTMGIKYLNNHFINSSLTVKGNHFVNGGTFVNGQCRLMDVEGAVVQNVHIQDGALTASSVYGYFGTPNVNVAASTFTFKTPHGMGNTARVTFEQWEGKVPTGIDVNKLYYVVNRTDTSFQVSEIEGGSPVKITDAGEPGFNISRFNYGRCYVSNVVVERDWRQGTAVDVGLSLLLTGGVIKNITVKNYDVDIKPPANYAGRPITVESLTVIEGAANFESCNISNSKFMKAKAKRIGGDIIFGSTSTSFTRKINATQCIFQNVEVIFEGNVVMTNSTFQRASIGKSASGHGMSMLLTSYLEDSSINLNWLTKPNHMTIARSIFNNVKVTTGAGVRMIDNMDLPIS